MLVGPATKRNQAARQRRNLKLTSSSSSKELNAIIRPQALLHSCHRDQVAAPGGVHVLVLVPSVLSMPHSHLQEMSKYSRQLGCSSELMGEETIRRCVPVFPVSPANRARSSRPSHTNHLHHALQWLHVPDHAGQSPCIDCCQATTSAEALGKAGWTGYTGVGGRLLRTVVQHTSTASLLHISCPPLPTCTVGILEAPFIPWHHSWLQAAIQDAAWSARPNASPQRGRTRRTIRWQEHSTELFQTARPPPPPPPLSPVYGGRQRTSADLDEAGGRQRRRIGGIRGENAISGPDGIQTTIRLSVLYASGCVL